METVGNQGIDHEYIVVDPIEKLDVLCISWIQKKENAVSYFARLRR
jgi:hypothetical protein